MTEANTALALIRKLSKAPYGGLTWNENGSRIRRILPNGRTVESDLVSRERLDRLIDFAMGSIDAEQHILHLHGWCDDPQSMIFSYRDYDRLYRCKDLHQRPFEDSQSIMTGGNPILFVGLGMSEPEINRTLEDFISNTPYHRTAPAFLLWNTRSWDRDKQESISMSRSQRAVFRMDKLHRLGIFTIFDTDVLSPKDLINLQDAKGDSQKPVLQNLDLLIRNVAQTAKIIGDRENYTGRYWRTMGSKIAADLKGGGGLTKLWGVQIEGQSLDGHVDAEQVKLVELLRDQSNSSPLFAVASAGWGKGQLGSAVGEQLANSNDKNKPYVLLANAGFCFDTDTFLDTIIRFFEHVADAVSAKGHNKEWHYATEKISRDAYFSRINLSGINAKLPRDAYCIVNGIDRFLDVNGLPLSAEFDRFIEQLLEDADPDKSPVVTAKDSGKRIKWLFLGSDRTRLYLERKRIEHGDCKSFRLHEFGNDQKQDSTKPDRLASSYLQAIWDAMLKGNPDFCVSKSEQMAIVSSNRQALEHSGESRRLSIERLRRAFLDAFLETGAFIKSGMKPAEAELAMEILRALAFIGLPVEEHVLSHVPRIFAMIDENKDEELSVSERNKIEEVLNLLVARQLVLEIEGFEDGGDMPSVPRYGLHRAVMTELRFRLGLPLSEAKLSTAFNMSLYVAQPVDGYIPEPDIHEELGNMIDRLIAGYKFNHSEPPERQRRWMIRNRVKTQNPPFGFGPDEDKDIDTAIRHFHSRGRSDYVACLRAALAVVRGYYSTTGLLTLDRHDRLIRDDVDGILLEHAERLDDLLDAYGKTAALRDHFHTKPEIEKRAALVDSFKKAYQMAEPFYADELVWLQNERGVVRLAIGDLHEANRSFQTALSVNKECVEYGDRSHNWRRIKLNQMTIEIERGELFAAERMIREVLESSGWPIDGKAASWEEAQKIFEDSKARKCQNCKPTGANTAEPKHYFLQEDQLAIAISLGYRGMCANLRGEMLDAMDDLKMATIMLRQLDEQRAFAYFSRLYAWALREVGQMGESDRQINIAIDAAQSTRQMDLVYRSEIMRAQWAWEKSSAHEGDRRTTAQTLNNALEYGVLAGVQRVRTEAASSLAKLKLNTGDHEVALQYTTEAMTIATRYNLRLRMMSIRVRLGEIMIRRGDEKTGRTLIMGAIKAANRSGFQRVVDAGQQVLDRLGGLN